jgi:hypothetical protein
LDIRELAVVGGAVPDELRRIKTAVRGRVFVRVQKTLSRNDH